MCMLTKRHLQLEVGYTVDYFANNLITRLSMT